VIGRPEDTLKNLKLLKKKGGKKWNEIHEFVSKYYNLALEIFKQEKRKFKKTEEVEV